MQKNEYSKFLREHNFPALLQRVSAVEFMEFNGGFELHFKVRKTVKERHRQRELNRFTKFAYVGKSKQRLDASVVPYDMMECFCNECGRWVLPHGDNTGTWCGDCKSRNVKVTWVHINHPIQRTAIMTKERLENKYKYNKK